MKEQQEIYINLDDSGKLTPKERICVYGGIVFLSKKEKDKFITQYKSIIADIRCKYCCNKDVCKNQCPEIKNTNILPKDKRRIMNYLKKYIIVALIIKNYNVYKNIINNKAAKGRFIDYSIRIMIKEIIKSLIKQSKLDSEKPIKIIINIDEQTTKSNGYYNLKEGLIEELKYGIVNFNYSTTINPILHSDVDIKLTYQNSANSFVVQASDLLAGTIRRIAINNQNLLEENISKIVDYKIIIP